MILKRFNILIVLRIILLCATMLALAWVIQRPEMFFNQITLAAIFILQAAELIRFVNQTNRELSRFLLGIKHADFTITFHQAHLGQSFRELEDSMHTILQAYKQVKIEKEAQYQFLQALITRLPIGIISIAEEDIVVINATAEKLLNIEGYRNWSLLKLRHPTVAHALESVGDHGRKLVEFKTNQNTAHLAIEVSTTFILDKSYRLITIQDIHTELEQKEIEAWHKLIRILTHEIMNSVTPVASLTETMQGMLTDKSGQLKSIETLTTDTLGDIRFSLNTIHKRSEGLLDFVEKYRALTRVPKPVVQPVRLHSFLKNMANLMAPEIQRHRITLQWQVSDENLQAQLDSSLIEQVIINLITNSIYALQQVTDKHVYLQAYQTDNGTIIEVTDNGSGIREKEMQDIFIPFFSTKKEGTGIGLSLSKQIMSLHGGSIKVTSIPHAKTSFFLMFKA
jgi:two-component system, NtrC family, nitrogen regulation sensor histidine kinase NtrY